jgi:hypothetical protein
MGRCLWSIGVFYLLCSRVAHVFPLFYVFLYSNILWYETRRNNSRNETEIKRAYSQLLIRMIILITYSSTNLRIVWHKNCPEFRHRCNMMQTKSCYCICMHFQSVRLVKLVWYGKYSRCDSSPTYDVICTGNNGTHATLVGITTWIYCIPCRII